jgi:hypothetical protein
VDPFFFGWLQWVDEVGWWSVEWGSGSGGWVEGVYRYKNDKENN